MSDVRTLPAAESVAIAWLVPHPLLSELVGSRVYADVPEGATYPLVRIERIGGGTIGGGHWLDSAHLQISAWAANAITEQGFGSARSAARGICEQAIAALHELSGVTELAVVTAVEDVAGAKFVPDPATHHPRFIGEVLLTLHPLREAS